MLSGACTQRCRDGCVNRRWIGFSEDDVRAGAVFAPRINGPRAGRLHCQRVWTTLSTLAICVMSVLPLSKNENVQEHHKWIGFLEDEGWSRRAFAPRINGPGAGHLHCQRVEDNAFHLGYFAP